MQIGDGVPKGSIRRAPAALALMEGGPRTSATATTAPSSARRVFSSNPFSKNFVPSEVGGGAARHMAAAAAAAPVVESMVSAMRLGPDTPVGSSPTPPAPLQATDSMRLPPPSYSAAGGDTATASPSFFSVPGLPTYPAPTVTLPSFAPAPAPAPAQLSSQEQEDLMDAILHDVL